MAKVSEGNSVTNYLSYDPLGQLRTETYPSGRVITTQYDKAERVSGVMGALGQQQTPYASQVLYAPHGGMASLGMGNGVWRQFTYNSRMQVQQMSDLMNNNPGLVLLDQMFDWSAGGNNGSLYGMTVKHGGTGFPQFKTFQESFSYDALNRVAGANGKDANGNIVWGQNWSYDRYGNMWMTNNVGVPGFPLTPSSNVFTAANQMQAGSYDAAGNQLMVGAYQLQYDAENRQKRAQDTSTIANGAAIYQYDGDGHRVQKLMDSGSTVYVHDAFDKLTGNIRISRVQRRCAGRVT